MHVRSLLTEDIGGMSFLGDGFELVVAPAVLPVAVPRMFHHLEHKNDRKLALHINIKKCQGYLLIGSSTAACLHDIFNLFLKPLWKQLHCAMQNVAT